MPAPSRIGVRHTHASEGIAQHHVIADDGTNNGKNRRVIDHVDEDLILSEHLFQGIILGGAMQGFTSALHFCRRKRLRDIDESLGVVLLLCAIRRHERSLRVFG